MRARDGGPRGRPPSPRPPLPLSPNQASASFSTLKNVTNGFVQDLESGVLPLTADLTATAVAAKPTQQPFDAATFDWSSVYNAGPQGKTFSVSGAMKCMSDFALCAFAVCQVVPGTSPLVAECGCLPVRAGVGVDPATSLPKLSPFSLATNAAVLDAKLKVATTKLCTPLGVCAPNPDVVSGQTAADLPREVLLFTNSSIFNTSPFCLEMLPSPSSGGKPTMYKGMFDLVSTFNPFAWKVGSTVDPITQGAPNPGTKCPAGAGVFAYCEAAACLERTSFNGMPATCWCPRGYVTISSVCGVDDRPGRVHRQNRQRQPNCVEWSDSVTTPRTIHYKKYRRRRAAVNGGRGGGGAPVAGAAIGGTRSDQCIY